MGLKISRSWFKDVTDLINSNSTKIIDVFKTHANLVPRVFLDPGNEVEHTQYVHQSNLNALSRIVTISNVIFVSLL